MIDKYFLPQLQELTDSMITLDGNMTHMNFIHESITDLNESLSSLLYGLMCNSWCVDFPRISHDTPHELSLMEKLNTLRQEKESLLAKLRPQDPLHDSAAHRLSLSRLPQPTTTTKISASPSAMPKIPYRNENEVEDDNTAASFVSNPTSHPKEPRSAMPQRNLHRTDSPPMQRSNIDSKLRRRSILHQMRNGTASMSTPVERKRSLAVSAKRIPIQSSSTTTSTTATLPSTAANTARARPTSHTNIPSSKRLSSRPPFR